MLQQPVPSVIRPLSCLLDGCESRHSYGGPEYAKQRQRAEAEVIMLSCKPFDLTDAQQRTEAARIATDLLLWGKKQVALRALRLWDNPEINKKVLYSSIGASECGSPSSVAVVARLNPLGVVRHAYRRLVAMRAWEVKQTIECQIDYKEKAALRDAVIQTLWQIRLEKFHERYGAAASRKRVPPPKPFVPPHVLPVGLDKSRPNSACAPH